MRTINLSYRDILIAAVKAQGIHQGKWAMVAVFSNSGMNAAVNGHWRPASVTVLAGFQLGQVKDEEPPTQVEWVDAAEVNPAPVRLVLPVH